MKLMSFVMALPLALIYIIVLGTVLSIGLTVQLLRELLRGLRKRKLVTCSWCGGTYVKGGNGNRIRFCNWGQPTNSHGICADCFKSEVATINSQPKSL
jgi:hypothetical protein